MRAFANNTHRVKNSLCPRWTETIQIEYKSGETMPFEVCIYDETSKAQVNKAMGVARFEVGAVLASHGNLQFKKLPQGGVLYCRITTVASYSVGTLQLYLRGVDLKNVDGLFGKSDPFVEISAQVNVARGLGMTWQPLFRSKQVMDDLNPIWEPCLIDLNRLLEHMGDGERWRSLVEGNDYDNKDTKQMEEVKQQPLLIAVYDWEKSGRHKCLGQFETTVQALLNAETPEACGLHITNSANTTCGLDWTKAFTLYKGGTGVDRAKEYGKVFVTRAVLLKGKDEEDRGQAPPMIRESQLMNPCSILDTHYS